ncbi:S-layer homology domain-containing protein [Paenibacillus sp. CGMCC 1.16610]|uniref:SLH domain-containing protein n=1 Tax=Paenibacillus anseongense TaxID=2682845 RepID=A0ABW9U953_9BACL|nr:MULTISPECIES: S-layer homology domain-containing protein [Paenibacillus]MBA2937604.1 S-layer homology domain-containing protein [Paenibacillus sp. CGMCC 1.16610]MVQ36662.1 hypothetical protein [Paenibacillus anseongense]
MKRLLSLLSFVLISLTLIPVTHAANDTVTGNRTSMVQQSEKFNDLSDLPQDILDKFDVLIQDHVFDGVSDHSFGLNEKMNRAQFAKVAAMIFALPIPPTGTQSSFADVHADDPANGYALPYIEALKTAGLTNGSDESGKLYNPAGQVTRQELAAFLVRGLKWQDSGVTLATDMTVDDWAKGYVTLAIQNKLMTNIAVGSFGGSAPSTRKTLALASFEARHAFQTHAVPAPGSSTITENLPPGITVLPTKIELDETAQLSVGDQYYDANGKISTMGQPPVIGLKVTGPNNYEFTLSQIETLYSSGYLDISASGGLVLDNPVIGQSYAGLGKIVVKEVKSEGESSITASLTHIGDATASKSYKISPMRTPSSIEVNTKDMVVLAENEQPQGFVFTIKDQFGKVFNAASPLDRTPYMIEYKLERVSGEPSLQSAGGIFETPWDEVSATDTTDSDNHVLTWQLPVDKSGDLNKFMFKPTQKAVSPNGSHYTITASVINKNTAESITSAASTLAIYNWKDYDPFMKYELDMLDDHFAAGKYLFERNLIGNANDVAAMNSKFAYYGKEINIIATDDKNRRIDITKVLKDDKGKPISIIQQVSADADDSILAAPSVNTSGIPVYKAYGIQPTELFNVNVTFYTPGGPKTLTKQQVTVDFAEPVAKAVAMKNTTLQFNLNTVYTILKADGKSEQIKGSDYLASNPYVWEFLKFSDNNGQSVKTESGFFKYFIQATDQFGYKYQNTSDGQLADFIHNLDILKVQITIDTDNKYPPKWSVKDETLKDKIWIDDQFRLHYEPAARNADGSFDYSKKNLQSFSIELITPSMQRSWCTVTLSN